MANLDTLKALLQITGTSQDTLLSMMLNMCGEEYLSRTHQHDEDWNIVIMMAVEKYNKLGNEGIASIRYSGISESYTTDYSEALQKLIRSKTKLVMI